MHGHDGPDKAHIACLGAEGQQAWAYSSDPDVIDANTADL
jgi:hypothetical protein